jgi:hypothetical protein
MLWEFGTNSAQLRERKNGCLVPTLDEALGFFEFLVGIQEVGDSKPLGPTTFERRNRVQFVGVRQFRSSVVPVFSRKCSKGGLAN